MSRFFDELVSNRQRGTAPGQDEPAARPSLLSGEVSFSPVSTEPNTCSRCGAAVEAASAPFHSQWHRDTQT